MSLNIAPGLAGVCSEQDSFMAKDLRHSYTFILFLTRRTVFTLKNPFSITYKNKEFLEIYIYAEGTRTLKHFLQ